MPEPENARILEEEERTTLDEQLGAICAETSSRMEKEWVEPRADILRQHEIRIQFLSIGCVMNVGCKSIPFSTSEEAMKELNEYVANPHQAIKKWNNIFNEYK